MTVNELRKRLDDIAVSGRGEQEIIVRVYRTRRTVEYFALRYASNGGLGGIPGSGIVTEISGSLHATLTNRGWSNTGKRN